MRNAYNILVAKPEGKRPLKRPWFRWEDNARMIIRKTLWEDVDWMHVAQDTNRWRAVVNTVMNIQGP
jgi:hypothetical protein